MKIVGLTGGIGSGKSTVAKVFESLGVPVFRADDFGRKVLAHDPLVVGQVSKLFGEDVYANGKPDRAKIASVVFGDRTKLKALNEIIHPAVGREFHSWQNNLNATTVYCIREAAILFESGSYKDCDHVVCVSSPDDVRIERVMERDSVTKEQVVQRMKNQIPQGEMESRSDFIIQNDGLQPIIPQVLQIHHRVNNA